MPNARDAVEELRQEMHALRDEFFALLNDAKDIGEKHVTRAAGRARHRAMDAAEHLAQGVADHAKRAQHMTEEAQKAIANRPIMATSIALGLGLLVGALLSAVRRQR
jgi:ElaB/YqjD/DUF883 family membrane-anchored ribosome-binding protein